MDKEKKETIIFAVAISIIVIISMILMFALDIDPRNLINFLQPI